MDKYEELLAIITSSKEDFIKFFDKGNAAAGTRVRKVMQEVKDKAQNIRNSVQDIKRS